MAPGRIPTTGDALYVPYPISQKRPPYIAGGEGYIRGPKWYGP